MSAENPNEKSSGQLFREYGKYTVAAGFAIALLAVIVTFVLPSLVISSPFLLSTLAFIGNSKVVMFGFGMGAAGINMYLRGQELDK